VSRLSSCQRLTVDEKKLASDHDDVAVADIEASTQEMKKQEMKKQEMKNCWDGSVEAMALQSRLGCRFGPNTDLGCQYL
jgi:hypothetical protein